MLRLRRLVLPATGSPLGAALGPAYELTARVLGGYLTRGIAARTYARGSLGIRETAPGHSDLDLAVVTATHDERARVQRRWKRLRVPDVMGLVDMAVYERGELRDALSASLLTSERALQPGVPGPGDDAGLRLRPGVPEPLWDWRPLGHGPNLLPQPPIAGPQERRVAAWLELQFAWRVALAACAAPSTPHVPRLGLKLAADPARVWLWLAHGEKPLTRWDAVMRAAELLPEEAGHLRAAPSNTTMGHAALTGGIALMARMSERIAALLGAAAASGDHRRVRLVGEVESAGLPLVDWHALAFAPQLEETFMPRGREGGWDPDGLAAASRTAAGGHHAATVAGPILVLAGGGWARPVQCAVTDPVSFALIAGDDHAFFPELAGWSASDWARRAVAEHAGWLAHKDRGLAPLKILTRLLAAVRAARFAESLGRPEPELAVTAEAVAGTLGDLGDEALHEARRRRRGMVVRGSCAGALREAVTALPAYSGRRPAPVAP